MWRGLCATACLALGSPLLGQSFAAGLDLATGVYTSPIGEIDLSFATVRCDIVGDPSAGEGRCAWMDNAPRNGWYVQWPWDGRNVAPGIAYRLSVRVKVRKTGDRGEAFGLGVWDRGRRQRVIPTRWIPASEAPTGDWKPFSVGKFKPAGMVGYFYLTSGGNAENVPDVYLDSCTLTPLPTDDQRGVLQRFLQTRTKEMQDDASFARDFRPLPTPSLSKLFVFGTCVGETEMRVHSKLFDVPWEFYVRQRLRDVQAHGCNLAFDLCTDSHSPQLKRFVEIAQQEQIYVVAGQSHVIHGGNRSPKTRINEPRMRRKFADLVPHFRGLDRFLFWYLVDEPRYDQCDGFLRGKAVIEEADGHRPAIPLLNTPETIRRLGPHQQILITDRYPMYRDGTNPWCVGPWVEAARQHARGPMWLVLPTYSSTGMRMTQPAEASLMTFLGLINGAKGIVFYTQGHVAHWERPGHPHTLADPFGTPHPTWTALAELAEKLRTVGPLLMSTAVDAAFGLTLECESIPTWRMMRPALAAGILTDTQRTGWRYLVVVNNDTEHERQGTLHWPGNFVAHDLFTTKTVGKPRLRLTLSAGEGKVYLLGTPREFAAVASEMLPHRYEYERDRLRPDLALKQSHGLAGAAQALLDQADIAARHGDYERALEALHRARSALARAETGPFVRTQVDLASIREALSDTHRAATAAAVAGNAEVTARLRADLLPPARRYYTLLCRFAAGEAAGIAEQTAELRKRLSPH